MDIFPDMLKQLIDNKHGWNPKLGYKVVDGKLVKLPENEEITADDEEAVLCYLYFKFLELRDFEDKAFDLNNMNYFEEYNKLKNETLDLFKELFFNLWD